MSERATTSNLVRWYTERDELGQYGTRLLAVFPNRKVRTMVEAISSYEGGTTVSLGYLRSKCLSLTETQAKDRNRAFYERVMGGM